MYSEIIGASSTFGMLRFYDLLVTMIIWILSVHSQDCTEMAQKEIIEGTGFRSALYFSRIFKKYTSYTPEKYRKQRG